jgi:hypothetical protein
MRRSVGSSIASSRIPWALPQVPNLLVPSYSFCLPHLLMTCTEKPGVKSGLSFLRWALYLSFDSERLPFRKEVVQIPFYSW